METTNRDERRAALDQFANNVSQGALAPVSNAPPPAVQHQVSGAQALAVYRDERVVLSKIREIAAVAGQDFYYRFPVRNRKENRTDYIEGPSIKCANELVRIYGNCEVDCRAQDLGSATLFHARFIDLESGFALTRPFQQRKSAAKLGGNDDERREDMAFQIGASKAIRNVVVNALRTYADYAVEEAKAALVDKIGRDLPGWRDRTIDRISARIDLPRVEAVIGRRAKDWLAPDVARVIAMGKAVEDGMASWDETFPPLPTDQRSKTADDLTGFADERKLVNQNAANPSHDGSAKAAAPEATQETGAAAEIVDEQGVVMSPAELRALHTKAIDMALRLAGNPQLTVAEKLEELDGIAPALDELPEPFVKTVVKTAAQVAEGKMKAADARPYLEGLIK
jgi:hypothetical protein